MEDPFDSVYGIVLFVKDYLNKQLWQKQQKQQASAKTAAKKRIVKVDAYGDAHISATFNNIIIMS